MARPRAIDYDDKRHAILARSAELFAERGYARTSMMEIGEACGISKALFYHYYTSKEQLLADMLDWHLAGLDLAVTAADEPGLQPAIRLRDMVRALLAAYATRDALHKVQMNDLDVLPAAVQARLKAAERRLVERFARAIGEVAPELQRRRDLLMPVTMSLFGMLNWHHTWFRDDGPLSRDAYADLATRLLMGGVREVGPLDQAPD